VAFLFAFAAIALLLTGGCGHVRDPVAALADWDQFVEDSPTWAVSTRFKST
jgi:hypothetical protein